VTQKLAERKNQGIYNAIFNPRSCSRSQQIYRKKSKSLRKSLCLSQVIEKLIQYHSYHSYASFAFSKKKKKLVKRKLRKFAAEIWNEDDAQKITERLDSLLASKDKKNIIQKGPNTKPDGKKSPINKLARAL